MSFKKVFIFYIFSFFICVSAYSQDLDSIGISKDMKEVILKYEKLDLTQDNIAKAIIDLDIKKPKWVFKQMAFESGWFKSYKARKGNNLCGMKKARRRINLALPNTFRNNYAKYKHWIYSIADYKLWQDMLNPDNYKTYFDYLVHRGYFEVKTSYYRKIMYSMKIPKNINYIFENYKR